MEERRERPLVPACIETRGLSRSYGETMALKPLDLEVAEGEWLTVMGHSGSGKSTLLNLLGGLDRPTGGNSASAGSIS